MNREIKFRGKKLKTGEWVYGYYAELHIADHLTNKIETQHAIFNDEYGERGKGGYWNDVDLDTVGQFTGLHDNYGKEIYEGDIIRFDYYEVLYSVVYSDSIGAFVLDEIPSSGNVDVIGSEYPEKFGEIIGNIHDTPELLK